MIADSAQNMDFSTCYTTPTTKSTYNSSPTKQKPVDVDRLIGQITRNRERLHERTLLEMDAEINGDVLGDGNFPSDNKYCREDYIKYGTDSFPVLNEHDYKLSRSKYMETISSFRTTREQNLVVDSALIKEQIKKLDLNAIVPIRATKFSACKDLFSPIDDVIPAGKNLLIKTNIAIAWDNPKYYMQLLSRSGMAYKGNVVVQAGVIDWDYKKNIGVLLQNNSDKDFFVKRGDRIAQFCYIKINTEESEVVDEFTISLDSDRKDGWGSTGR